MWVVYNSVQLSPTVAGLPDFDVSLSEADEIPTAAESHVAVCTEFFSPRPSNLPVTRSNTLYVSNPIDLATIFAMVRFSVTSPPFIITRTGNGETALLE